MTKVIDFNKVGINKDFILNRVTEEDIFEYYIKEPLELGRRIKSPFRQDNNPSFSIFSHQVTGELRFKDFGNGLTGNCFELVKRLYDVDIFKAYEVIASDLKLSSIEVVKEIKKENPVEQFMKYEKKIIPVKRAFRKLDYDYWNQFHIPLEYLVHDHCYAANYIYLNKAVNDTVLWGEHRDNNPIYVYEISGKHKVYRPYADKKSKWLSTAGLWDVQGLQYIDKQGDILFITSSMKDRWVLKRLGYNAIAPAGEAVPIPDKIMDYLFSCYKQIYIFYDTDEAGFESARKLTDQHPELKSIFIPEEYGEKDISDTVKVYGLEEGELILNSLI